MDKTAEEFRKIHAERQNLLEQWENTIEQMQKRDREMDQLAVVRIDEWKDIMMHACIQIKIWCQKVEQKNTQRCGIKIHVGPHAL